MEAQPLAKSINGLLIIIFDAKAWVKAAKRTVQDKIHTGANKIMNVVVTWAKTRIRIKIIITPNPNPKPLSPSGGGVIQ